MVASAIGAAIVSWEVLVTVLGTLMLTVLPCTSLSASTTAVVVFSCLESFCAARDVTFDRNKF